MSESNEVPKQFLKLQTPYERRSVKKMDPYDFADAEAHTMMNIREYAEKSGREIEKVFDEIAEDERRRADKSDWYSALSLAGWYVDRDTKELGSIGSSQLQDGLMQAHLRFITNNAPTVEEINLTSMGLLPKNNRNK